MSQNVTAANPAAMERVKFKKQSQAKEIWRRFRKNRGSMVGLIMLTIIVLALVFANLIISYDAATAQNLRIKLAPPLQNTGLAQTLMAEISLPECFMAAEPPCPSPCWLRCPPVWWAVPWVPSPDISVERWTISSCAVWIFSCPCRISFSRWLWFSLWEPAWSTCLSHSL